MTQTALIQKVIILIASIIIIGVIISTISSGSQHQKSPLVQQIVAYQDAHASDNEFDLTPILKDHLEPGMSMDEVSNFFRNMGFATHLSWRDQNTLIADYRSNIGSKRLHIINIYRFTLHFEKKELKTFEGKAYSEGP